MDIQDLLTESYQQHGVSFSYPSGWTLTEQASEEEIQVMVQSPGTGFWILTLYFERPAMDDLIQSAIETYRDEYQAIDSFPSEQQVGAHVGSAVEIEFSCLDLMNTASIRTFATDRFTVLILSQYSAEESEQISQLQQLMTQSIQCAEDFFGFEQT
ncbi:hypothetical protein Pla110_25530 [Polystyrenella longa]|uniref:Uncharacterized protein n=1 Tax=Polystyrenella longa TaxID=2528007 RepID=A0A518CNN4_9PLAN|nr:hypothetical protein [Polystyrenella longa]QDU80818.1 hypothetical protein Pla110_25530 [Polystyrenella longa]